MSALRPNFLVRSDALDLMERIETESVDLVYLDPPWNTSRLEIEDYDEYIFKVIQQSKRILNKTGSLFFHSTPKVNLNIQPLLTRVFGESCHVADFIIPQFGYSYHLKHQLGKKHETILCYSKSDGFIFNKIRRSKEEKEKNTDKLFRHSDEKGNYRLIELTSSIDRPNLRFNWRGNDLPDGRSWRYSLEALEELVNQNMIVFSKSGRPRMKRYLEEKDLYKGVETVWNDVYQGSDLQFRKQYASAQPMKLFERIVSIGSKEGDLILDPFCGAGGMLLTCSNLNRKWMGSDISEKAIDITTSRFSEEIKVLPEHTLKDSSVIWNEYEYLLENIEDEILRIIVEGESREVEFKESAAWNYNIQKVDKNGLSKNIIKAIAAFLNSENGGILLIGVKDHQELIDLRAGDYEAANSQKKNRDGYELFLMDKILTHLGSQSVDKCNFSFVEIDNNEICKIDIQPSVRLVFLEGEFYVRNGNRNKQLNNKEFFEYIEDRFDLL